MERDIFLIPYCKYQNGYASKWGYEYLGTQKRTPLIYGYCSPFYGDYAIIGQYHYHSQDKNLTLGLINKSLEIVENLVYSYLRPYKNNCNCFIGTVNSNMFESSVIFINPSKRICRTGKEILPIDDIFFGLREENSISIYNCDGFLKISLPLIVDRDGKFSFEARNNFRFKQILYFEEIGFRIEFSKSSRETNKIYEGGG
jgi:hypothetical protein